MQYPVASALLALIYSDYMLTSQTASFSCNGDSFGPSDLRNFAISQVPVLIDLEANDLGSKTTKYNFALFLRPKKNQL